MPALVHAVLVVRPEARATAALHLRRTLAALEAQSRRADALSVVVCGAGADISDMIPSTAVVVGAPASTGFAAAVALATAGAAADAVWLLAQDTAPEKNALERLAGALERAPSVGIVAPKVVRWDDRAQIVSLGVTMTRLGRTVGLADDEFDQGQHDAREDVLGSDVRGVLVRAEVWRELGGLDPALFGADEGLDLGVRARLAGHRVTLEPGARIAVAHDGVAGPPAPHTAARRRSIAFAERGAQLHRRLVYAHPLVLPLLWLAVLPIALWRTAVHFVRKEPDLVGPEWAASFASLFRFRAIARSRRRIARARSASWSQLAPLRVTQAELRERFDDEPEGTGPRRDELRFFSGGGAWLVLAALVASIAAFPALLAWPTLGGGALEPLRETVGLLWADVLYGARASGLDTIGPADPFAAIIAVVGSLWPSDPSRALVLLWVAALPLAALGGWFAATRVTERSLLRITGGVVWALAPTFLTALVQGRPTAVIAHLLLPWLFYAGAAAHRSWVTAGAASLLFAGVVACAPALVPALVALWVVAMGVTVISRAGRGVWRVVWVVVPALALAAPLVWHQLRNGEAWGLLADPGLAWAGPQNSADAGGRALVALGFPTADLAGWQGFAEQPVWWVPLLAAPLALLALLAPLTPRWAAGMVLLVVAVLGVGTAIAALGIAVSFAQSQGVPLWPGTGLSLAWIGALGAALVTLDTGLAPRLGAVRAVAAALVVGCAIVIAVPSLSATARGTALLTNGPASTLPAFVAAEGRGDPSIGTIVLTPQNAGGVSSRVVWGASETLGSHATMITARTHARDDDSRLAELTADLVAQTATDVVDEVAASGISFVLLAPASDPESDAARTFRLSAQTALDQRLGLDAVGQTAKGVLWRVAPDVAPRPDESDLTRSVARWIALVQLVIVAIALLLAIPTAASRRAARRTPRIIGPAWQEGR